MAYRIEITSSAEKELARLGKADLRRVVRAIEKLKANPRYAGAVKLSGAKAAYRIRAGDYRIVYTIKDRKVLVVVIRVRHRKDVYKGL